MEILLYLAALLVTSEAQSLSFPEEHDRPGQAPERLANARLPIAAPDICPGNQLYYPGDQLHDWVCDCGPGFIYYPPKDACFEAYKKGPCPDNQHLILPKGKVIPECVNNPCRKDGFVMYNNNCYELNSSGPPCRPANEGGGVFGVNVITLELECLEGKDELSLINFPPNCPLGSKRGANRCRPEYRRK